METTNPSDHRDPTRELVREWKVTAPLPPRFKDAVWRRIERAERLARIPVLEVLIRWWLAVLPRPAVAVSCVLGFLALGIATGYWQARSEIARVDDELGLRYVQSVDPYQKPRL